MKKFISALLFLSVTLFAESTIQNIEWDEAVALSKKGAVFLDVRTPAEVAEGSVTGTLTIPLNEISTRFTELPKKKTILVYCRSGKRSAMASEFLMSQGYDVRNIRGGFLAVPPKKVLPHN